MSEFTPGPWTVEGPHHLTNSIEIFPAGSSRAVGFATLFSAWKECPDWLPVEEQMANARLIAAAPELLELAKRVQWLLAQRNYPGRERDEATILKEAEAAIQKAIGQAVPHA